MPKGRGSNKRRSKPQKNMPPSDVGARKLLALYAKARKVWRQR